MAAAQSQKAEESKPNVSGGVGGLIGGFGRRMAQRKSNDEGQKARATFMTITHEQLSVATSVAANDIAIPAGFKEDK